MIIYTDGACSGNPGPGGFGVVVLNNKKEYLSHHSERTPETTNNREEMKAIIWAFLKYGVKQGEMPTVFSDSRYAVMTFTSWMFIWNNHAWTKSNGQTPENLDLIKIFWQHWNDGYRINLQQVKGHAGDQWNELADQLATGKFKG